MSAREAKLMIRLQEEKKNELQAMADQIGMSMSALGSYIIGQYLYQQRQVVKPMLDSINETVKSAVMKLAESEGNDQNG